MVKGGGGGVLISHTVLLFSLSLQFTWGLVLCDSWGRGLASPGGSMGDGMCWMAAWGLKCISQVISSYFKGIDEVQEIGGCTAGKRWGLVDPVNSLLPCAANYL